MTQNAVSTWLLPTETQTPPAPNLTAAQQALCDGYRTYCQFRVGVDVGLIAPLCLFGLMGNTMAFLVLHNDNNNKRVSFLLQALAVADNAYLVISLLMQTFKTVCDCTFWIPNFKFAFPPLEPYLWPLGSVAQMTGVWIVVLVTLDRYLAICHPFHRFRTLVHRHGRKGVIIIPIIAVIYNIPRMFERRIIIAPDRCQNIERAWSVNTALRKHHWYIVLYKTIAFFLVRMILPLVSLTVLNIKLISTVKGAKRERAKLTNQTTLKKDSFTPILIAVVTVFIFCQLPDFVLRVAVSVKSFAKLKYQTHYYATVTNMLLTLNSAINVVIYCLTGRRFRRVMMRMLCRLCYKYPRHYVDDADLSTYRSRGSRATFTLVSTLENGTSGETRIWCQCLALLSRSNDSVDLWWCLYSLFKVIVPGPVLPTEW